MNFQNLGDRIVDDQGNVKTVAGSSDARLYYINSASERKKYLLEGEVELPDIDLANYVGNAKFTFESGGEYFNAANNQVKVGDLTCKDELKFKDYDVVKIKNVNSSNINFFDDTCVNVSNVVTEINLELQNKRNALCIFTTGDTITFTISFIGDLKINKPFAFEANTTYAIAIDNGLVYWTTFANANA